MRPEASFTPNALNKFGPKQNQTKVGVQIRLITLNIWGGRISEPLKAFVSSHAKDTDIFCFQEVFDRADKEALSLTEGHDGVDADTFSNLKSYLPSTSSYFNGTGKNEDGLAMFVRSAIMVKSMEYKFVYRWYDARVGDGSSLGRIVQYAKISNGAKTYTILNFHGLWTPKGKMDMPERTSQSEKMAEHNRVKSPNYII